MLVDNIPMLSDMRHPTREYHPKDTDIQPKPSLPKSDATFTSFEIPIYSEIVDHLDSEIRQQWATKFLINKAYDAISNDLSSQQESQWEAKGGYSVGGYVDIDTDKIVDTFKELWYHFPMGYRTRAKWYIHTDFMRENLAGLVAHDTSIPIVNYNDINKETRLPQLIGNLEVVYIEQSVPYPIVLSDMSRAMFSWAAFYKDFYAGQCLRYCVGMVQPAGIKVGVIK